MHFFTLTLPEQPARDGGQQDRGNAAGKGKGKGKDAFDALTGEGRDHINALGLPNDGYDYDQHLKSIGERASAGDSGTR